jgi:hypothetical protein
MRLLLGGVVLAALVTLVGCSADKKSKGNTGPVEGAPIRDMPKDAAKTTAAVPKIQDPGEAMKNQEKAKKGINEMTGKQGRGR